MKRILFVLSIFILLACSINSQNTSTNTTHTSSSTDSSDTVNLTGKLATEIPGTPIELGTTFTSVIDKDTRKHEVVAVSLKAGETLRVHFTSTHSPTSVRLFKPDAVSVNDRGSKTLCDNTINCTKTFIAAVDGIYYLKISTVSSGVQYTLTVDTL